MGESCTLESLIERVVCIFESDILAHHTDDEYLFGIVDIVEESFPLRHVDYFLSEPET